MITLNAQNANPTIICTTHYATRQVQYLMAMELALREQLYHVQTSTVSNVRATTKFVHNVSTRRQSITYMLPTVAVCCQTKYQMAMVLRWPWDIVKLLHVLCLRAQHVKQTIKLAARARPTILLSGCTVTLAPYKLACPMAMEEMLLQKLLCPAQALYV